MTDHPYRVPQSLDDLRRLIDEQAHEGLHLEFKSCLNQGAWKSLKNRIGEVACAFANTEGGVIVIGIEEENEVATSLVPVTLTQVDRKAIENTLIANVRPKLDGYEISEIECDSGAVWVVHVPKSWLAPHQAANGVSYARRRYRNDPLDTFELDMIRASRQPPERRVFGGLAIEQGQLLFVFENKSDYPVYDITLDVPSELRLASQQGLSIFDSGISVLPARSAHKMHLVSVIDLFEKKILLDAFIYVFSFSKSRGGQRQQIAGELCLRDLGRTRVYDDNNLDILRSIDASLKGIRVVLGKLAESRRR